ncbi:MAG: alpha/beta hydrolase [Candidatus Thorarchaeota archaeon]
MKEHNGGVKLGPEGANVAFLLVHGFGAAPDEVTPLGEFLAEHGVASYAVRIAGHGTTPEDLSETTWHNWYDSVVAGFEIVKSWNPNHLFVAGLSMGGALALMLASREKGIDGIVAMSPAVYVGSFLAKFVPILKYFVKYRTVDISDMSTMYEIMRTKYTREPFSALHEILKLTNVVRRELHSVTIPILVVQSGADKTIDPKNGTIVYEGVSSKDKALHIIPGAEHVITCHAKRFELFQLVKDFVKTHTS